MYLGEICLIVFFCLFLYFVWAEKRKKQFYKREEELRGWYCIFYSGIVFPMMEIRRKLKWHIKGDRLEQMKKIYVGKGEEEIFCLHYGKMACLLSGTLMISLLVITVISLMPQKEILIEKYFLARDGVSGQEKTVHLSAALDGDKRDVTISVPRKKYTSRQLQKKLVEAKKYVNQHYLGENPSAEKITKPLNLVTDIPENAITVSWKVEVDGVINKNGSIKNEELEDKYQTEITAVFSYGNREETMTKMLTILPRKKTKQELSWEKWQKQLEVNQKSTIKQPYLKLPDKVEGKQVRYGEKKKFKTYKLLGIALFFLVMVILLQEERMRKELRYREKELRMDYPEFVEHFVLLIGAGLNVKGAWKRIVQDYEKEGQKKHYVYEEMLVSEREMENGMGEARAYELFGKRTGILQYMKFCTLIVQNLKKGSDDLLRLLDYEVADAFRERKENAKALGEETGTKLLLPMMLMLVVVFALILYAAFHNM